jgi:hypothetical protein
VVSNDQSKSFVSAVSAWSGSFFVGVLWLAAGSGEAGEATSVMAGSGCSEANHVVRQRTQRTERPDAPSAAGWTS